MNETQPIVIIEDSDEDYDIATMLLRNAGVTNPLVRCRNGREASAFVSSPLPDGDAVSLPCLILLDLNLPGGDGRELLLAIRDQYLLQTTPVIVLTTSSSQDDVRLCYRRGAHGYVLKPVDFDRFEKTMQVVADYWLRAVERAQPEGDAWWPLKA